MNCPHEKENSDCLEMDTFDAIVQMTSTEANIFSIDRDLNLGENRDASLGELPSESDADPDRNLPYVKRIDCASCGEEMEMTQAEIEKMNKIEVKKTKMKSFRFYLDIKAENREDAQSKLEESERYDTAFDNLECIELQGDAIDQQTTEELKKFFNITNDDEILSKIEALFGDWQGWSCLVEDCYETIGCDTGDMFDHLKIHTKEELEEVLKR